MADRKMIYLDDAIEAVVKESQMEGAYGYMDTKSIVDLLRDLPSAQPERKTGRWIKTARWGRVYYCDQCRNYLDFNGVNAGRGSTNFCPNCGSPMQKEGEA